MIGRNPMLSRTVLTWQTRTGSDTRAYAAQLMTNYDPFARPMIGPACAKGNRYECSLCLLWLPKASLGLPTITSLPVSPQDSQGLPTPPKDFPCSRSQFPAFQARTALRQCPETDAQPSPEPYPRTPPLHYLNFSPVHYLNFLQDFFSSNKKERNKIRRNFRQFFR